MIGERGERRGNSDVSAQRPAVVDACLKHQVDLQATSGGVLEVGDQQARLGNVVLP